jgi:hypothetical protein
MFNLKKIKDLFKKKVSEKINNESLLDDLLNGIQDGVEEIDYDKYPNPEIIDNGSDKTILFLDDMVNMWFLYDLDIHEIKDKYKKDVYEDFNIIKCFGREAGFTAHKFIFKNYKKVDFAILDITLGYGVKLLNGEYVEYDGIDVFLELYKRNPDMKFLFCTAHTLNIKNPTVGYFFKKFESETGLKFKDHYLNKNSKRSEAIYKLLY